MGRILIGSLQFVTEAQIGHSALRHMVQYVVPNCINCAVPKLEMFPPVRKRCQ